ncbi:hypothetical protein DYB37_010469 [Aphanomyces astaci]|nr:hypothetical protein DYB36_008996 [Aphanomyces astaci]RHY21110.1 hypothetical protein DYB25_006081 [Aphanomyces astaci]RHY39238.1 hypothetical protein DYB34_006821 [Aphanomyces astaci]RHY59392.1 hypothetical protein DYB38_004691 [Aphanomyces astaci]RHY70556.1 hypothetical protein DYB30_007071 [Aphanomyces astaci]
MTLTGSSTVVTGGLLHVNANNFKITSDGTTSTFLVTAATGAVSMAGDLALTAAAASITHSGATSLTVSTPSLIVTGGTFVMAGSAGTASAGTCVQGTIMYDTSFIYICSTANAWYKATLAPI